MKRLLAIILLSLVAIGIFTTVDVQAASKKVKLNKKELTMIANQVFTLKLKNAPKKDVTWVITEGIDLLTIKAKGNKCKITVNKDSQTAANAQVTAYYNNKAYSCNIIIGADYTIGMVNTAAFAAAYQYVSQDEGLLLIDFGLAPLDVIKNLSKSVEPWTVLNKAHPDNEAYFNVYKAPFYYMGNYDIFVKSNENSQEDVIGFCLTDNGIAGSIIGISSRNRLQYSTGKDIKSWPNFCTLTAYFTPLTTIDGVVLAIVWYIE